MKRLILILILFLLPLVGTAARAEWVVIDGGRTAYYRGSAGSPEQVPDALGIPLRGGDRYTLSFADGRRVLTVRRLQVVTLRCFGQTRYLCSYGEPVGALLRRYGFPEDLVLSCEAALPTFDGMQLSLRKVQHATQERSVELPPRTQRFFTDALAPGQTRLLSTGSPAILRSTDAVFFVDGKERSRVTLTRERSEEECARLLLVGADRTLPVRRSPAPGSGDFTYRKKLHVEATAYCCEGYRGITATGTTARVGAIAVDPRVIPYGTLLYIESDDGAYVYGCAAAEDCGAFRGNRIDLYFDTVAECITFGRRMCTVYVLD